MRISDWSSSVCSSDLFDEATGRTAADSSPSGAAATSVASATQTRLYRFTAAAGEDWYFDLLSHSGGTLSVRVYRPDGVQLAGPENLGDISLEDLPMAGEYLIAVEGDIGNEGGASFRSEGRRVGKECVSTCGLRGSPDH